MAETKPAVKKPALGKILLLPIDKVADDEDNENFHPNEQKVRLRASIRLYGQVEAILVDRDPMPDGRHKCLNGHGIKGAMLAEGYSHIRCELSDLEGARRAGYRIITNQLARMSHFDPERLAVNVADIIKAAGKSFDPMWLGMSQREIDKVRGRDVAGEGPAPDIDHGEELQKKYAVKPGDLWKLGRHRLLCGDSTNPDDVNRLLRKVQPKLCVTDPPYGVNYDPNWRAEQAQKGNLDYAPTRVRKVTSDSRADWSATWALCRSDVIYCWHDAKVGGDVKTSLEGVGFEIRNQIIWGKSNFPISRGHYHWRHEPCWYAVRKGTSAGWLGGHDQTTLWDINLDKNVDGGHSTQKPLEAMARPIRNHKGDVYEPFAGTGTTLVAAHVLDRRCFAIDIDPVSVAIALDRMTKLGLRPERT